MHMVAFAVTVMLLLSAALAFVADDRYRPPPQSTLFSRGARPCSTTRSTMTGPASCRLHMSSIGGGNEDDLGDGGDGDDSPLNEWIQRKESENVRRARERFAEGRLPISYGAMNSDDDEEENNSQRRGKGGQFGPLQNDTQRIDDAIDAASTSSSLSRSGGEANPYLRVVSRLAPSDLIARFTATASPRVQDAVRTTVLGLIGGLPQMAFETKTVATGERLASLMFQLQMTGYMFKNAEYRLSLSQSLGRTDRMLPGGIGGAGGEEEDARAVREGRGRLKGKIKVRYGGGGGEDSSEDADEDANGNKEEESNQQKPTTSFSTPGMEVEVDAQAYMSELRGEVSRLRDELDATKQAKEEEIRKDLLMYIRTLPQQELQQLTGTMSPDVLEAMKGLVTAVLAGIGEDDDGEGEGGGVLDDPLGGGANRIGPSTVTEQSGEALAQLCMWQLVVGFNLRELEVREEFRASMSNLLGEGNVGGGGEEGDDGVQFGPGALE